MITINGESHEAAGISGRSVSEYLESAGYRPVQVAVERNGEILPRESYASTQIEDGDQVEIVQFMGGGAI